MKNLILIFLIFSINALAQNDKMILGKDYAEKELKLTLENNSRYNFVDNKRLIIKDSITAINIAETILFDIYGKEKIEGEKPYEIYLIDNYWLIKGTLAKGWKGGTFLIIIDGRNSKVLKITHGK
jgi:hypothetical protein